MIQKKKVDFQGVSLLFFFFVLEKKISEYILRQYTKKKIKKISKSYIKLQKLADNK